MAKLLVIDSEEGTKVPFLRGILTGSLQDLGLKFDEAYELATGVREELSAERRIESVELRKLVAKRLNSTYGSALAERYQSKSEVFDQIVIRDDQGQKAPFSEPHYRKSLNVCGISEDETRDLSRTLGEHLLARKRTEIDASYLGRLTYRILRRDVGKSAAQRYLVWRCFNNSGLPLLLLVGGAPGSGKSTIATGLASRLDIFRTQSTDMLREIMRMMTPERLLPTLHKSSFDAWKTLPQDGRSSTHKDHVIDGFRSQTELLAVSSEAVAQRAVRERVSMVLEGVHIDPLSVQRLEQACADAIVVPVILAVRKQEFLRKRIVGRGGSVPKRRSERYLQNFDAIWQLQSYLMAEAEKTQIPIIYNENRDASVSEILCLIVDALEDKLQPTLDSAFPKPGHYTKPV